MISGAAPIRPKRIYLARRHPDLAAGTFALKWRGHGRLAMSFMARQHWSNVTRYVQCGAMRDTGIPGIAPDVDGVGMISFRDPDARRRHVEFAEARSVLEADEDHVFAARVNRSGLVADEHVLLDRGAAQFVLVRILHRHEDVAADAFLAAWRDLRAPMLIDHLGASLRRYVQDVPLPPERGTAWGLDCMLIDELWFEDRARLLSACPQDALDPVATGDAALAVPPLLVAATAVVLYAAEPDDAGG